METANYKQLSRYGIKDVLSSQVGMRFLLCVATDLDSHHNNLLSMALNQQMVLGIGGEQCRISRQVYHCLETKIDHAPFHEEIAFIDDT